MKHVTDLHRLLRIITLIQRRRNWTPETLAEELEVAKRTVFRDIDKLKLVGVPIEYRREAGGYRIQGEAFLQPLQLTPEEALALTAMCEHVARSEQIPFLRPAARALEKIRAQLPAAMEEDLAQATSHLVIQTAAGSPSDGYEDVYERIREAIETRTVLECEYESARRGGAAATNSGTFLFEPYALFFGVRAWYAIGRHGGHDQIRCLKLKRFGPMKATGEKYRIPAGFSVREYLRNAWGMIPGETDYTVELHMKAEIAETLGDTKWHATQEIEEHEDGSATFRYTVSGLDEIVWWVLSLGPSCRVVKPKRLADKVKELAGRTAAVYSKPG